MIGLDTNVIVRYIVQDDPAQSAAAANLFNTFTTDSPGYLPLISVVELVWVLESCYEVGRPEIEALIDSLLRSRGLVVEQAEVIWRALQLFSRTTAEFADCLIERSGHIAGCEYTATFDRVASKAAGMELLS